jgi:dTDP-glucose 4,6-dehydratase
MKTILVTGGCGFIPSHFIEHVHRKTDWNIVIIDKLTYASNGLTRLRDASLLHSKRIRIFTTDLARPFTIGLIQEIGNVDIIVHMAADTHVDNSIRNPVDVVENNVMSTVHLLEYARNHLPKLEQFFYFSTDEVYGSAPPGVAYKETDRHKPTNPYSASKSAAEQLCVSYENTYKIPLIMVNVMNAFGERQHVEKFIPKCVRDITAGKTIYIHTDTESVPGSRFYIHARNIADAVMFLIKNGSIGQLYHVTGEKEVDNLEMAQIIAAVLGKELKYELVNFHGDRPGHDTRYALDGSKLNDLGWCVPVGFEDSLRHTVKWTLEHPEWLKD